MDSNRIFNWGIGNIPTDNRIESKKKKKKGWLSRIADKFSVTPEMPDMREIELKVLRDQLKSAGTQRDRIAYETAILAVKGSPKEYISSSFDLSLKFAIGSISGPIGMSLKGITPHPLLSEIKFDNPQDAETALVNSVMMMQNAKDPKIQEAFPDAVVSILERAATDDSIPERAEASKEMKKILTKPGITEDEKKKIASDSIEIIKGSVSPIWMFSQGKRYEKSGSPASIEFAKFLNKNLNSTLAPIKENINTKAGSKTGKDRENAILTAAKDMKQNSVGTQGFLSGLTALQMIEEEKGQGSADAKEIIGLITDAENSRVASVYDDLIFGAKIPSLKPDFEDFVRTGKKINGVLSSQLSVKARWIKLYLDYMESKTNNPVKKQQLQLINRISKKIPDVNKSDLPGAVFDALDSDTTGAGIDMVALLGNNLVKSKSTEYSSGCKKIAGLVKPFAEEMAAQNGPVATFMSHSLDLIDKMDDRTAGVFAKGAMKEAAEGVTSPITTLASLGSSVFREISDEYSSNRQEKNKAMKAIFEKIGSITQDTGIKKLAGGASRVIDVTPGDKGFLCAQNVLSSIATEKKIDPSRILTKFTLRHLKGMSSEYTSSRQKKTESITGYMTILNDIEQDPTLKARFDRTLEVVKLVDELAPDDKGNLTVNVSNTHGYEIGMDMLENFSKGIKISPEVEIAKSGYKMVKPMSSEYSSQRKKKAILCQRFYKMIEKHSADPQQKVVAKAFSQMLNDLGEDAVHSFGVMGLENIANGSGFSLGVLADRARRYLSTKHEEYNSQRQKKSNMTKIIFKNLVQSASSDYEKNILESGRKMTEAMGDSGYGYKMMDPILKILSDNSETSTVKKFCDEGTKFISNNFQEVSKSGRELKTLGSAAFLSQLSTYSENPPQRAIAQMVSLFCSKFDKENGFRAALGALKVISKMEENPDKKFSIEELKDQLKENSDAKIHKSLDEFFSSSLGSVYKLHETLENVGEAAKEIENKDEYVVIGGVRVKKGK